MTTYDLDIIKGSTFAVRLTASNSDGSLINLSGFSARGYIREKYSSSGILYDMLPVVHTSYVSGIVDVIIPSTGTASLPPGQFVQDCEIYSGDYVTKFLVGYCNVFPEATY